MPMKSQIKTVMRLMICAFLLLTTPMNAQKKASQDEDQAAKALKPSPDKALVYVLRPSSAGFAIRMEVTCNGKSLGSTKGNRYVYALLDPGTYTIKSKAENTATLELRAEGGKTYYILQKVKVGALQARTGLELISDERTAQKKLSHCKLSGDTED